MEKSMKNHDFLLIDKTIKPEHDFYKYFGEVITDTFKYFRRELKWFNKFPKKLGCMNLPSFFNNANSIIEAYIPIWETLKTYTNGRICFHVYKMFYSLLKDPEFYGFSKYERNVLLWSVLLHDICKKGPPVIEGKDPAHPFHGAHLALHYFNDIFKFTNLSKEDMTLWDKTFEDGFLVVNGKEIQNHKIVPNVKAFLDEKLKDKHFETEVIYYVLLHQSVPTLSAHPHESMLHPLESEVPKYFDQKMIKLFRLFLRHDSLSYLLYNSKMGETFAKEIDGNVQTLEKHINTSE